MQCVLSGGWNQELVRELCLRVFWYCSLCVGGASNLGGCRLLPCQEAVQCSGKHYQFTKYLIIIRIVINILSTTSEEEQMVW